MAKKIFMTQWFSQEMLLAGESLIKQLDNADAKVQAAFWLQDTEEKTWRLTIVSPLVANEGPRSYYKRILAIQELAKADENIIALHDISVSDTDNCIVKAIKRSDFGKSIPENSRLGRNYIGGVHIEDMYLYRMDWKLLENNAKNIINSIPSFPLKKTPTLAQ
jgi:hypothetical protein